MMYNKIVEECFFSPKHIGLIDLTLPLTVHSRSEQNNQRVVIDLYLQCTPNRVVSRMCFKTNGNPYVIAALEWVSRQTEGKLLEDVLPFDYKVLIEKLDISTSQYPVALQVEGIYKNILALMAMKFEEYRS